MHLAVEGQNPHVGTGPRTGPPGIPLGDGQMAMVVHVPFAGAADGIPVVWETFILSLWPIMSSPSLLHIEPAELQA